MSTSPSILLIYPNPRIPFVFEELAAMSAYATVVHSAKVAFPEAMPGVVDTVPLDIYGDPGAATDHLMHMHAARPFDAIFPVHEPSVPFAARLAKRLGLRGTTEAAAVAARDKSLMRAAFRAAGMNVPNFVCVDGVGAHAIARLRFPLVVKPTTGYSSQGVIRADDEDALRAAVDVVDAINRETLDGLSPGEGQRRAGVIVEEYIDGPEWSAECFCQAGHVYVLALGEKGNPCGPYFEELRYVIPGKIDPAIETRCIDEIARGIRALGITDGPAHVELRLLDGVPYILEIGARLGGSGLANYMVRASSGRQLVRLVAQNLLGGADVGGLTPQPSPVAVSACFIVPVGGRGTIEHIDGLDEARHLPQTRHVLQFLFAGDVVESYPRFSGYPAFVLSQHTDYEDAIAFHARLEGIIRVVYE